MGVGFETLMTIAGERFTVTLLVCTGPVPQIFTAATVILPLFALAVALITFVVEAPVHAEGKLQVYAVAPATAAILYVFVAFWQMVFVPLMAPGVTGKV